MNRRAVLMGALAAAAPLLPAARTEETAVPALTRILARYMVKTAFDEIAATTRSA